jgi:hypothetical protein
LDVAINALMTARGKANTDIPVRIKDRAVRFSANIS